MHLLFNDPEEYTPAEDCPPGDPAPPCVFPPGGDMPPIGEPGEMVHAESVFDGWGYFHLIDTATMTEIDAYAPQPVIDERFARGFGDLTMHNVEADRKKDGLAYISWYSLGFRVLAYGDEGVEEVGHFIAPGGNNFWGVHVHKGDGKVILASDRDSGLWIFKYTGPDPKKVLQP